MLFLGNSFTGVTSLSSDEQLTSEQELFLTYKHIQACPGRTFLCDSKLGCHQEWALLYQAQNLHKHGLCAALCCSVPKAGCCNTDCLLPDVTSSLNILHTQLLCCTSSGCTQAYCTSALVLLVEGLQLGTTKLLRMMTLSSQSLNHL